jgi:hypothetical protein
MLSHQKPSVKLPSPAKASTMAWVHLKMGKFKER